MAWLSRLLGSFRGQHLPDPLEPVRPLVTPDPQQAAALERRIAQLDYRPEVGFYRDVRSAEDTQ